MERRRFLQMLGIAGAAAAAAPVLELIPGNRVWSFPSKIVIPSGNRFLTITEVNQAFLDAYPIRFKIGDTIRIKRPPRYVVPGELGRAVSFEWLTEEFLITQIVP